jgi:hypothetical protein
MVFLTIPNGSSSVGFRSLLTENGTWIHGPVTSTLQEITLTSLGTFPRFQIMGTSNAGQSALLQARFDVTPGDCPQHILAKSRGTTLGTDFTAVAANDTLGIWAAEGADGTDFARAGSIRNYCDGTVSTNNVPGRWEFYTANSSGVETLAMKINSSQQVILGTDPGGSERLRVGGTARFTETVYSTSTSLGFYAQNGYIQSAMGIKDSYGNKVVGDRVASASQNAVSTTSATNSSPYGFTTAAQANAIVTLVNALRDALVTHGLIKGSA